MKVAIAASLMAALLAFGACGALAQINLRMQGPPFAYAPQPGANWGGLDPRPNLGLPADTVRSFCQRLLDRECPAAPSGGAPPAKPGPAFASFPQGIPAAQGFQPLIQHQPIMPMVQAVNLPGDWSRTLGGSVVPFPHGAAAVSGRAGEDDHGILEVYRTLNGSRPASSSSSSSSSYSSSANSSSSTAKIEKLGKIMGEFERMLGFSNNSNVIPGSEEVTYLRGDVDSQTLKEMGQMAHEQYATKSRKRRSLDYGPAPAHMASAYGPGHEYPSTGYSYPISYSYQPSMGGYGGYGTGYNHYHPTSSYGGSPNAVQYWMTGGQNPLYEYSVRGYLEQQLKRAQSTMEEEDV